MKRIDRGARITATLHAGDVKPVALRVVTDGQSKRQRIFDDDRVATDIGFFADAAELVHTGIRANVSAVLDHYMTGEGGSVCHDDAVADQAVVRDVRLGHDEAVVADSREHSAAGSSPVNGDEFAYLVTLADNCFRWFAFV